MTTSDSTSAPKEQSVHDVLDMKPLGDRKFLGPSVPSAFTRTFGGQVVAQALRAAQLTVEGKRAHSLHSYFLEGGIAAQPIEFEVEHVRDGRTFSCRRVEGFQNGKRMMIMTVNFHHDKDRGPEHATAMPQVPGPEEAIDHLEIRPRSAQKRKLDWMDWDIRAVEESKLTEEQLHPAGQGTHQYLWFKNTGVMGDDQDVHQAALTYLSDMTLLYTALLDHPEQELQVASLDHAMWFLRPERVDEWLLVDQYSPSAGGGVGLTKGNVFNQQGELVAVLSQEGLMREPN